MSNDFATVDAVGQAALVRAGDASPLELTDAAIARIEKLNPDLNAVIHPLFEKARADAEGPLPDGPLRGVPVLLKDFDTYSAGDPFHAGMAFLKARNWVEPRDTWLVRKLRSAGAVVAGKTNTPELGLKPSAEPLAYGPTRNPWDTSRSPGGSSGGSAAAVASGMVAIAHAADGGGSIRIPASMCGLVGLKPTTGRVSLGPFAGDSWHGFVAQLGVSRTVRDTALLLDVFSGPMPGDPYLAEPPARPFSEEVGVDPGALRVGILTLAPGGLATTMPECAAATEDAARLLESLGHHVDASAPAVDDPAVSANFLTVVSSWIAYELDDWAARTGEEITEDDVEASTWTYAEMGRQVTGPQYVAAREGLYRTTRTVTRWWADGYDVLVTPTVPEKPPVLGGFEPTAENPMQTFVRSGEIVAFTAPFNVTGQPAISLPLAWSDDGLPIGVQLIAAAGREDVLLRVASQLEVARPWADRWPPVSAVS